MKKIGLLIIAVGIYACSIAQQGVHLGIVGGPQASWLFNKQDANDPTIHRSTGFKGYIGGLVDYHWADKLGIGVGVEYAFQGQKYSDGSVLLKRNVDYVRIPVTLDFNTSSEHLIMLIGKIGPEFNIVTKATQDQGTEATFYVHDVNVKSNYHAVNVGAIAGLGIGFNIKKVLILSAGVRFDAGFTNALVSQPDKTYFSYYGGDSRDRTWSVAGGFEFGAKFIIPTK